MLFLFNNSLAELPGQAMRDISSIEFLRLNNNPWACGCEARPLWEFFRSARLSSSEVLCASPAPRRGQDLRFLREMDFALCPFPDPGSLAGSTTTTFSTKTRWWISKNKPVSTSKGIYEKSSETRAYPLNGGKSQHPSITSTSTKYELGEEEALLPKLDPEEYWANYGNEDAGITSLRCFELECPPEFDSLPPSSSSSRSSSSVLLLLSMSVLTVCIHLLFGWICQKNSLPLHFFSSLEEGKPCLLDLTLQCLDSCLPSTSPVSLFCSVWASSSWYLEGTTLI